LEDVTLSVVNKQERGQLRYQAVGGRRWCRWCWSYFHHLFL